MVVFLILIHYFAPPSPYFFKTNNMNKKEKIDLINSMLETIGLSTLRLNPTQKRNTEEVFNHYVELNPQLQNLDAVKTDRFIQSLFNVNYLIEPKPNVWLFNHFFIERVYNIININK